MTNKLIQEALSAARNVLLERPDIQKLLHLLNPANEETRIVGGAVRDALSGRSISDVDMATTLSPDDVIALASKAGLRVIPTGLSHGTVTVMVEKIPFEVTTLREDIGTDGRHANVRFGRSFEIDAKRRDFTINALSLSSDGTIYDYCDGLKHLFAQEVRFIGNARMRIQEDYLRILRFFRFSANFSNTLDRDGLNACIQERYGLQKLSSERIRSEFFKLLCSRRALAMVQALSQTGIFTLLTGGVAHLDRLKNCITHEEEWHLSHDPLRHLAGLTVFIQEDALRLSNRLRLSNQESARLLRFAQLQEVFQNHARIMSRPFLRQSFALDITDNFHSSTVLDLWANQSADDLEALSSDTHQQWHDFFYGHERQPQFPLRGKDLLCFMPAGQDIGRILSMVFKTWLVNGCPMGGTLHSDYIALAKSYYYS